MKSKLTGKEDSIIEEYKAGATGRQLAKKHKVCLATICNFLRKRKLVRKPGRPKKVKKLVRKPRTKQKKKLTTPKLKVIVVPVPVAVKEYLCSVSGKPIPALRVEYLLTTDISPDKWTCIEFSTVKPKKGIYMGEVGTSELRLVREVGSSSVREMMPEFETPEETAEKPESAEEEEVVTAKQNTPPQLLEEIANLRIDKDHSAD